MSDTKRPGRPLRNPAETVRSYAAAVVRGELTQKAAAAQLGIKQVSLSWWMRRHGYRMPSARVCSETDGRHNRLIEPTDRDLKALREYWRRDCTQRDVIQYTGRSYSVVHRWIEEEIGRD